MTTTPRKKAANAEWGDGVVDVEYALSRTTSPTLVAEYQTMLPPKALLRRRLYELYAQLAEEEPDGSIRHELRDESPQGTAGGRKPTTKRKGRRP